MKFKALMSSLLHRFAEAGVESALTGGLALSRLGLFRSAKHIDCLLHEPWAAAA